MKVRITRDPLFHGVSIILYAKDETGKMMVAKPLSLEMVDYAEGTVVEPTLRLDAISADSFLASFADALDNQGVKTTSDHHVAGELKATKAHLEDMRGLLAWFTQKDETSES